MLSEYLAALARLGKKLITSRLFILGVIVVVMFSALTVRLFQLQIIEGATKQEEYISQKTQKTVSLSSTRGKIYDRNGNVLADNELVYVVNVTDNGDYRDGYAKNEMLLRLIDILNRHGEKINTSIPIYLDEDGVFQYSCSEQARYRFLRDMYGLKSVDDLLNDTSGKTDKDLSAGGVYDYLYRRYGVGYTDSSEKTTYEIDTGTALQLINIRYLMSATAYQRYLPAKIATNIGQRTIADILEHSDTLLGVTVDEAYQRVYPDGIIFSHLIGYTGRANEEQITELNEEAGYEKYSAGDIVGMSGIEATMEQNLQGIKGERAMYLDSLGHILEVIEQTDPVTGSDVWLTVDRDLSVGIYNMLERKLAGILLGKLVDEKVIITAGMNNQERLLSSYSVYYQFFNNNLLDLSLLQTPSTEAEQRIADAFAAGSRKVFSRLEEQLSSPSPQAYRDLDADREEGEKYMQTYMSYLYNLLADNEILNISEEDREDGTYIAYKQDETISLAEFLHYALDRGWVNTDLLAEEGGEAPSAEEAYPLLKAKALELAHGNTKFIKKILQQLIYDDEISPCDLCLAMMDQGVLVEDAEARQRLESMDRIEAFSYIWDRISDLSLTPAMLALDPCTAAVTVTDVNSGDVIACVAYPGYDNNLFSGTVDAKYYQKLISDLSSPLYNAATQAQTAPGSVFKPVTAMAALETGKVRADEPIETLGVFKEHGLQLKCWIYATYEETHGIEVLPDALRDSCNYYFSVLGNRLAEKDGQYSDEAGLETLAEYASALGLGDKSGIEIVENAPHISDTSAIPSAIGQGTHLYSNVQLARYVDTLANGGTVYDLSLLDKLTSVDGTLLREYTRDPVSETDFSAAHWYAVRTGLHKVVQEGTVNDYFSGKVDVAGKTGSAEENKLRPNHANFIGFAPYDNPEIAVTVTIPYGYTSGNAADLASDVFDLYYGYLTLEDTQEVKAVSQEEFLSD